MAAQSLTIIIPYWHGEQYLPACLQSIYEGLADLGLEWQILVVHNGGKDPLVPPAIAGHVEIIRAAPNIGFGLAVNLGLHLAFTQHRDAIAILNQDCLLQKDCFRYLLSAPDHSPALFTPLIMTQDLREIPSWYRSKYLPDVDTHIDKIQEVSMASATCLFGSAQSFMKAGFFDPVYFMYYEDDDYTVRFRSGGGKLYVVPLAKVGHAGNSTEPVHRQGPLWKRTGYLQFLIRHGSTGKWLGHLVKTYASALLRLRLAMLLQFLKCDIVSFRNFRYLRQATSKEINARAMQSIAPDERLVQKS